MSNVISLEDFDLRQSGTIILHHDDGTTTLEDIDLNPKQKVYRNFSAAKSAITRRLRNMFGQNVKFEANLQDAIDGLALMSSIPFEEEEEVRRAVEALHDIESTDTRRERWLFGGRK